MKLRPPQVIVVGLIACLASCAGTPRRSGTAADRSCALIETDDDITSGSATAGSLYVGEDDLGRRLLTSDVVAVAQGFRDAGYGCIVVADSHERALDHDRLAKLGLRVISPGSDREWRWPFFGVAGPEFKVAALVGFHARAGASGFRPHTVNDDVKRVTINGVETGEVGIAMLGLSALGMSPVLVVGDEGAVADARDAAPRVRAVAVRWHDATGAARFLSETDAARVLRSAARDAAAHPAPAPVWGNPLRLTVTANRARAAPGGAQGAMVKLGKWRERLSRDAGDASFAPVVRDGAVTWTAADGRAAYLALVAVTASLRSPHRDEAWDLISQGFAAYQAGRHDEALAAYRKALELDDSDAETRCRIGQVHLARAALADALTELDEGLRHLDEMSPPMRTVCLLGHARALARSGRSADAAASYRRVLQLPDHQGSHAKAREVLGRRDDAPRPAP